MRPLELRHTVIETVVSRKIDYSRFFLQLCVVFLMHSASSRPPKRRGSWKVSLSLHISKINSNRSRKHGPQLRMKYVYIPVSNCRCRLARTAHTCWSCARRCPASRARAAWSGAGTPAERRYCTRAYSAHCRRRPIHKSLMALHCACPRGWILHVCLACVGLLEYSLLQPKQLAVLIENHMQSSHPTSHCIVPIRPWPNRRLVQPLYAHAHYAFQLCFAVDCHVPGAYPESVLASVSGIAATFSPLPSAVGAWWALMRDSGCKATLLARVLAPLLRQELQGTPFLAHTQPAAVVHERAAIPCDPAACIRECDRGCLAAGVVPPADDHGLLPRTEQLHRPPIFRILCVIEHN